MKKKPDSYSHLPSKPYWVCWDLVNGHWQEHCYLWVYESKVAAWLKYLQHWFHNDSCAPLSIPQMAMIHYFKPEDGKMYNQHYFNIKEISNINMVHPIYGKERERLMR